MWLSALPKWWFTVPKVLWNVLVNQFLSIGIHNVNLEECFQFGCWLCPISNMKHHFCIMCISLACMFSTREQTLMSFQKGPPRMLSVISFALPPYFTTDNTWEKMPPKLKKIPLKRLTVFLGISWSNLSMTVSAFAGRIDVLSQTYMSDEMRLCLDRYVKPDNLETICNDRVGEGNWKAKAGKLGHSIW